MLAMFIYGTSGIVRKLVPLSSCVTAVGRAIIAVVFLLVFLKITGRRIDFSAIRRNLLQLIIGGFLLGFNWVLLFEAYAYTTVAKATLCYYMAPVIVILLTPLIFHDRLTKRQICCIAVAALGMVLVSGVLQDSGASDWKGIALGLGAALFYAGIIISNKFMKDISPYDSTLGQFIVCIIFITTYTLLTEEVTLQMFTPQALLPLLWMGIINTGISYVLYYGSIAKLETQILALYSYIDPVVACILSALLLKEAMTLPGIIGAVLIIGSLIFSELKT